MASVLEIIQGVAKEIGVDVPSEVFASTDREYVELAELANNRARRLMRAHAWSLLKTIGTLTGDGSTVAFTLPTDYDRMLQGGKIWSSSIQTPYTHIIDSDHWLELKTRSFNQVINAWTIYGGQLHLEPAIASGATGQYFYVSKNICADTDDTPQADFMADTDKFRLTDDLLFYGMIWKWKSNKGQPYGEALNDYATLLSDEINKDKGSKVIRMGRPRLATDAKVAYPIALNQ